MDILKVLDEIFPFADVYCRLMPDVKPFLKENLVRLNDKAAIHECLTEPIPRQAWKLVFDCKYPEELFKELEGRRTLNKLGGGRHASFPGSNMDSGIRTSSKVAGQVDSTLRLLNNYGSGKDGELSLDEKILAFRQNLLKRLPLKKREKNKSDYYILDKIDSKVLRIYDLDRGMHVGDNKIGWKSGIDIPETGTEIIDNNELSNSLSKTNVSSTVTTLNDGLTGLTSRSLLEELLEHKRERYLQQKRADFQEKIISGAAAFANGKEPGSNNFGKPEIRFVAHLHEHSEKITKLVVHNNQNLFATSSLDRTVKLWSLNQIKNKQPSAIVSVSTIPHREFRFRAFDKMSYGNNDNIFQLIRLILVSS